MVCVQTLYGSCPSLTGKHFVEINLTGTLPLIIIFSLSNFETRNNDNNNNNYTSVRVSGTSFTLHMTRESSNSTTATNYALEGDIKDKPGVPVIEGDVGKNGPWLELIPGRATNIPKNILTKTHCLGYCSAETCGSDAMTQTVKNVLTVRSFKMGCLLGTRAVETKEGLVKELVTYNQTLVKKAIHIFRHPLDNIVARFHLKYNVNAKAGNVEYTTKFPKNAIGFRRWCAVEDKSRALIESPFIDAKLRKAMEKIPCFNEFYRYIQWHNLAFATTQEMNIPTMLLNYQDYSTDFENTRDRVLNFLGLPRVGDGFEFHSGKEYRSYYTPEEKLNIHAFIQEFASYETWKQLKVYDFTSPSTTKIK